MKNLQKVYNKHVYFFFFYLFFSGITVAYKPLRVGPSVRDSRCVPGDLKRGRIRQRQGKWVDTVSLDAPRMFVRLQRLLFRRARPDSPGPFSNGLSRVLTGPLRLRSLGERTCPRRTRPDDTSRPHHPPPPALTDRTLVFSPMTPNLPYPYTVDLFPPDPVRCES